MVSRVRVTSDLSYDFLYLIYRGDDFRKAFSSLGNLRSILPSHINVMALTATATKETLLSIEERLSLKEVKIIGLHPNRANIKYIVRTGVKIEDLCDEIGRELMECRILTKKTVIFCRTSNQCIQFFLLLKNLLGPSITEPPGLPENVLNFRLVDMFTAGARKEMREEIVTEFCRHDTKLRVIVATSAFGLGVDCPDISRVISWGPPNMLEDLVQESGRAGRNGEAAEAILYYRNPGKNVTKEMRHYGENTRSCRRILLFKNFLFSGTSSTAIKACNCCDLCAAISTA